VLAIRLQHTSRLCLNFLCCQNWWKWTWLSNLCEQRKSKQSLWILIIFSLLKIQITDRIILLTLSCQNCTGAFFYSPVVLKSFYGLYWISPFITWKYYLPLTLNKLLQHRRLQNLSIISLLPIKVHPLSLTTLLTLAFLSTTMLQVTPV
jgi:hypothetical protein